MASVVLIHHTNIFDVNEAGDRNSITMFDDDDDVCIDGDDSVRTNPSNTITQMHWVFLIRDYISYS